MNREYLEVCRLPYEEPYHIQLEITASNGVFTGSTDIYCNVNNLEKIGHVLQVFPRSIPDEYKYEYGSNNPADRYYRYFFLRVYTVGSCGHSAVQISINQNQDEPGEGVCLFSIRSEPASINRLGDLFVTFSKLQHFEFKWFPNSDENELR